MKYYIYVDESGQFDELLTGRRILSVVGGVCGRLDPDQWHDIHVANLEAFKSLKPEHKVFSYPQYYHCGPLLGDKKPHFASIPKSVREDFVQSVFASILEHSDFAFVSKSGDRMHKRFEYSPQATYVMNLIAALRLATKTLALRAGNTITAVEILIAQRTIKETTQSQYGRDYLPELFRYVEDQLSVGEGDGVSLVRSLIRSDRLRLAYDVAERHPGLIAADFACSRIRGEAATASNTPILLTKPDADKLLGDYREFHERHVRHLLDTGHYATSLDFMCRFFPWKNGAPDIEPLLGKLESEDNIRVLEREVDGLLAVVQNLGKYRTEIPSGLACSTHVTKKIITLAKRQFDRNEEPQLQGQWLKLQLQALGELVACHNHAGNVGPQEKAEQELEQLLHTYKNLTGMDTQARKSYLLKIKNRNLNVYFNDYRFEDAFAKAERLSDERRSMMDGDESDKLYGEILGSIGQARAFMAKTQGTFAELAMSAFRESRNHFEPGSREDTMSRNFALTLLWQLGRLEEATEGILQAIQADEPTDLGKGSAGLVAALQVPSPRKYAFEMPIVLRILAARIAAGEAVPKTLRPALIALEREVENFSLEHPFQFWPKWMGVLHYFDGNFEDARINFVVAEEICFVGGFTMRTIGLNVMLMRLHCLNAMGAHAEVRILSNEIGQMAMELLAASPAGFANYLKDTGGLAQLQSVALSEQPTREEMWQLATWLPFAYS